ncbi:MAG: HD domain-containing protein [Candidatus Methanoperedens sp.]
MAKKFKVLTRLEHIKNANLAEYATPYPLNPKDEHRTIAEEPCEYRNAFIRDRDRIVHSESFRKLQGKTQVLISELGPVIRNRLTHTMEVWQISVSIARMLRANIHLTEAIAFGHDLGHTPFGHAGEIALDKIMIENGLEGFSHNEQSVKVVSSLESTPNIIQASGQEQEINSVGLNLTKVTKEGLFKHTDRFKKRCKDKKLCDEFGKTDGTIEAQIVNISDDIAQHTHDLNDFWKRGAIAREDIVYVFSEYGDFFGDLSFIAEKAGISVIISVLIDDVVEQSLDNLNEKYNGNPRKQKFINYSNDGQKFSESLKQLIDNVILSDEVNQMNARGRHIIHSLFKIYTQDPYCLPNFVKERLQATIQKDLEDPTRYCNISIKHNDDKRVVCDYLASMTDGEAIDVIQSTII